MSSLLCAFVVHFKLVCVFAHIANFKLGLQKRKPSSSSSSFYCLSASSESRFMAALLWWFDLTAAAQTAAASNWTVNSLSLTRSGTTRLTPSLGWVLVCVLSRLSLLLSPSLVVIVVSLITHTHTVCTKCGYKVSPLLEKAIRFSSPPSTTTFSLVCSCGVQACLFVCLFVWTVELYGRGLLVAKALLCSAQPGSFRQPDGAAAAAAAQMRRKYVSPQKS